MKCEFRTRRSDEWLAAERLRTGENVPEDIDTTIDITELWEETRSFLLAAYSGKYPKQVWAIHYSKDFVRIDAGGYPSSCYSIHLLFDGDSPSPENICDCLSAAFTEIAKQQSEWKHEQAEKEAKEAKLREARELLANLIADLESRYKEARTDRKTLGEFLRRVPLDALRGTLRLIADEAGGDNVSVLQETIEDASPAWIFTDREDEEDEDDE